MSRLPSTPPGLGTAGRALWKATVAAFELNPPELALLAEACRTSDTLQALSVALRDAPLTVEGSVGQPKPNPLLAEARAQRQTFDRLCRSLALPIDGEEVGRRRSPEAQAAAHARWSKGREGNRGA
jgi:hypothetical protein